MSCTTTRNLNSQIFHHSVGIVYVLSSLLLANRLLLPTSNAYLLFSRRIPFIGGCKKIAYDGTLGTSVPSSRSLHQNRGGARGRFVDTCVHHMIQNSSSFDKSNIDDNNYLWINRAGFQQISNHYNDNSEYSNDYSHHDIDVTIYTPSLTNDDNCQIYQPTYFRISPHASHLYNVDPTRSTKQEEVKTHSSIGGAPADLTSNDLKIIQNGQEAAEMTLRWCNLVASPLNLCPWAQQSLSTPNAIRIKIVMIPNNTKKTQTSTIDPISYLEDIVKQSSLELIHFTDSQLVNDNIAITFVVAVPSAGTKSYENVLDWMDGVGGEEFTFDNFYSYTIDLEDKFLDNADFGEGIDQLIGNEVTIASFHPRWTFGSFSSMENDQQDDNDGDEEEEEEEDYDDEDDLELDSSTSSEDDKIVNEDIMNKDEEKEDPINYEKRSPYPTISIVRTSAIEKAGEEATKRIAIHNEKILTSYGSQALKKLFRDKIWSFQDNQKKTAKK